MGLLGILVALGLLIWLAYRGWSILLLAPAAAVLAAGLAGEPVLAHWTQTFMGSAARFIMQFFPIFLLGALFGKLMEDSGSVTAIANFMKERLGPRRAVLAVVLAGALVTMAASASSSPSLFSPRWRMNCFARLGFRNG
jgi:H+/gluconate symporter-like permease